MSEGFEVTEGQQIDEETTSEEFDVTEDQKIDQEYRDAGLVDASPMKKPKFAEQEPPAPSPVFGPDDYVTQIPKEFNERLEALHNAEKEAWIWADNLVKEKRNIAGQITEEVEVHMMDRQGAGPESYIQSCYDVCVKKLMWCLAALPNTDKTDLIMQAIWITVAKRCESCKTKDVHWRHKQGHDGGCGLTAYEAIDLFMKAALTEFGFFVPSTRRCSSHWNPICTTCLPEMPMMHPSTREMPHKWNVMGRQIQKIWQWFEKQRNPTPLNILITMKALDRVWCLACRCNFRQDSPCHTCIITAKELVEKHATGAFGNHPGPIRVAFDNWGRDQIYCNIPGFE